MKIISLSPSVTEILFEIGAGKKIIANTSYCNYPEESKKITKAGSWIHINDQKIFSLNPDIIITSTIVQKNSIARYKNFKHIHLDPRSIKDIYDNILLLGNITGCMKMASLLVDKLKKIERKLINQSLRRRPKIYIEEWFDPAMVSGNWVPDIVRIAGGNYFPGIKKNGISRKISDKEISGFNPDIIFVSYCGYADKSDPNKIINRPGWSQLRAVKNNNIFILNDELLNRPGPRVLKSAEKIQFYIEKNINYS